MEPFVYEPLDLGKPSFRLIRLVKGSVSVVQCELFHAAIYDAENAVEYEALSYTWGGTDRPDKVEVNGMWLPTTRSLSQALQHLRYEDEDRVLWIDAICINQDDHKERSRQVQQMPSLYENAERVVIWLGPITPLTDVVFAHMQELEKWSYNHPCKNWRPTDGRWRYLWSTAKLSMKSNENTVELCRDGFTYLLRHSWFYRVWIIQEVAKARRANVMCGTYSVSTRIFAVFPNLIGTPTSTHQQAVLDIMPGPTREHSWWSKNRDLRTLLRKFQNSEASDPRDKVYALLGISSDAHDIDALRPDYDKTLEEMARTTMSFLLTLDSFGISSNFLCALTFPEFLKVIPNLRDIREAIIINRFGYRHDMTAPSIPTMPFWGPIELSDPLCKTVQTLDKVTQILVPPGDNGWALLLDINQVDSEYLDWLSREGRIPTPLIWAAQRGREDIVEAFLASGIVNFSAWKHGSGEALLFTAVQLGHSKTVQLLLERQDVALDSRSYKGLTPLGAAAERGDISIVEMLLKTKNVDVNQLNDDQNTPLTLAVRAGHTPVVKMLLENDQVSVDPRDRKGTTPLALAAALGHTAIVALLLGTGRVEIHSQDQRGRTPLSWAVARGYEEITDLLRWYDANLSKALVLTTSGGSH